MRERTVWIKMDPSKLNHLRQIEIAKPCPEDWDTMEGDERKRFCTGCGCFVNNISAMGASEAETLLASKGKTCTRISVNPKKGILTRDGWIPRLVFAGAVAATVAGCSENSRSLSGASIPTSSPATTPSPQYVSVGLVAPSLAEHFVDEESSNTPEIGWPNIVAEKRPGKVPKKSVDKGPTEPESDSTMFVGMVTSTYEVNVSLKKTAQPSKKKT